MKTLTVNNIEFDIKFNEEIEGTYVVDVSATDSDNKTYDFQVNCQTGITYDYKESQQLSCSNESGGDISDSGLVDFLEENGIDAGSEAFEEIVNAIEEEAQDQITIYTVEDYLNDKLCNEFKFEKCLGGACYAHNCSVNKYIADDGTIAVVAEDSDENVPGAIIEKYRVFDDNEEYSEWFDEATEEHQGNWSGDCGLAFMIYKAI